MLKKSFLFAKDWIKLSQQAKNMRKGKLLGIDQGYFILDGKMSMLN
jgi:hypothetical protein